MKKRVIPILIILLLFSSLVQGSLIWLASVDSTGEKERWQNRDMPTFFEKSMERAADYEVLLLKLEGIISSGSESEAPFILKQLENDDLMQRADAIILELNSPGGTTGITKKIYDRLKSLRNEKEILCLIDEVAASGGYYIASACSTIFARLTSIVGSIGVIGVQFKIHRLLEKLGIEANVIKAGKFKDASYPFRPSTKEETAMLQSLIDESYRLFLTDVASGRNVNSEIVRTWAEGRIFSGKTAMDMGMIDVLGGLTEAQNTLEKEWGSNRIRYRRIEVENGFLSNFIKMHAEIFFSHDKEMKHLSRILSFPVNYIYLNFLGLGMSIAH